MENQFERVAMRVSAVTIIANLLLSAFKFLAGILAHSGAMVSDAVHSASDVFSTFIVMIGIRIAGKDSDKEHPYGHERMECVAALVLATILFVTGLGIGASAVKSIALKEYSASITPGILALVAAFLSIAAKEAMYWYTKFYARKIDSAALMADAWHHRSDSLSSIGAIIGILGARMGYPVMEPAASLVICLFIGKAAYDIFKDAVDKMVDKACDGATEEDIRKFALAHDGIFGIDLLHTRMFGNKIYVDLEIRIDGNKTLWEAHEIAELIHDGIEQRFPKVKHIMVHMNPTKS